MELGIDGRAALVMGGSRGIGLGVASALAREGARVAIASRSRQSVEAAADRLGDRVEPFVADTADLDRLAELPHDVEARLGPLAILVTNTGGPPPGGALDHPLADWEAAYRSLVLAPRVLIGSVISGMRERRWGRVVNVASTSVREPIPGLALSNAHRTAALGFFKTLAREVAADGVTVNTIATGRIDTHRAIELGGSREAVEERARAEVPAGRLGTPQEYGDLVAFVCSERAAYLTGAVIPLDGGLMRSL